MWLTLTPSDLAATLLAPESAALGTFSLGAGAPDPIVAALAAMSEEVRGYVSAHAGVPLGQPGTIPSELSATALAIARWRLLNRLATGRAAQVLLTDARRREYDEAVSRLKDVAAGRFFVSPPDDPAPTQPRNPSTAAFGNPRQF